MVAAHADFGVDVARFRLAYERVDHQPIDELQSAFHDVLMGAMDWVSGLESDDGVPAVCFKYSTRLGGWAIGLGVDIGRCFFDRLDCPAKHHFALGVDVCHAGVGLVFRSVDLTGFQFGVVSELVIKDEGADYGAFGVLERDFCADG